MILSFRGFMAATALGLASEVFADHLPPVHPLTAGGNHSHEDHSDHDHSRVTLTGINLSYADLSGTDFFRTNLNGSNLEGANLAGANLVDSTLGQLINLRNANLKDAIMTGAKMGSADLHNPNREEAISEFQLHAIDSVQNLNLSGNDLHDFNLSGMNFQGAKFIGTNLSGANLSFTSHNSTDFTNAILSGTNLHHATLPLALPLLPAVSGSEVWVRRDLDVVGAVVVDHMGWVDVDKQFSSDPYLELRTPRLELAGLMTIASNSFVLVGEGAAMIGQYSQSAQGVLAITLNTTPPGPSGETVWVSTDSIARLDGELEIKFGPGFVPIPGAEFTVMHAEEGIFGTFTTSPQELASLPSGLAWEIVYAPKDVILRIKSTLSGDYNGDGMVNTGDYAVWRDNVGAAAGTLPNDSSGGVIGSAQYESWKEYFGATAGGTQVSVVVPEPATLSILVAGIIIVWACRLQRLSDCL